MYVCLHTHTYNKVYKVPRILVGVKFLWHGISEQQRWRKNITRFWTVNQVFQTCILSKNMDMSLEEGMCTLLSGLWTCSLLKVQEFRGYWVICLPGDAPHSSGGWSCPLSPRWAVFRMVLFSHTPPTSLGCWAKVCSPQDCLNAEAGKHDYFLWGGEDGDSIADDSMTMTLTQ